jgi:hypothetical protein
VFCAGLLCGLVQVLQLPQPLAATRFARCTPRSLSSLLPTSEVCELCQTHDMQSPLTSPPLSHSPSSPSPFLWRPLVLTKAFVEG